MTEAFDDLVADVLSLADDVRLEYRHAYQEWLGGGQVDRDWTEEEKAAANKQRREQEDAIGPPTSLAWGQVPGDTTAAAALANGHYRYVCVTLMTRLNDCRKPMVNALGHKVRRKYRDRGPIIPAMFDRRITALVTLIEKDLPRSKVHARVQERSLARVHLLLTQSIQVAESVVPHAMPAGSLMPDMRTQPEDRERYAEAVMAKARRERRGEL